MPALLLYVRVDAEDQLKLVPPKVGNHPKTGGDNRVARIKLV